MRLKLTHRNVAALEAQARAYDVRDTDLTGFIARVRPNGSISYLMQYRDAAGRQQSFTIGQHGRDGLNPTTARDRAEAIRLQARTGHDPHRERKAVATKARADRENTLRAYLEGTYQRRHLAQRRPRSAEEARRSLIHHFGDWLDDPLAALNPERVRRWRDSMRERGRTDETVKRVQAELTVLTARAVRDGVIATDPLAELEPVAGAKRSNIRPRYLLPDERARLLAALDERDRRREAERQSGHRWRVERGHATDESLPPHRYADHLHPMVLVSLNTGIRRGELFKLRWSDLGSDVFALNLRAETTKSGDPRSIPANAEVRAALSDWQAQTGATTGLVFPGSDGKPLTTIKTAWSALLRAAGIERFRWHDLRHDFASQLVMRGVPLNTVRELMGHTTLEMTMRYAHLSDQTKTSAVELLG